MPDPVALRVVLRGRVQMVGFRWFACEAAERLGVDGWVRNRPDGAVEVEAAGARQMLEEFLLTIRKGPPASRVADVELKWLTETPSHDGFHVRR